MESVANSKYYEILESRRIFIKPENRSILTMVRPKLSTNSMIYRPSFVSVCNNDLVWSECPFFKSCYLQQDNFGWDYRACVRCQIMSEGLTKDEKIISFFKSLTNRSHIMTAVDKNKIRREKQVSDPKTLCLVEVDGQDGGIKNIESSVTQWPSLTNDISSSKAIMPVTVDGFTGVDEVLTDDAGTENDGKGVVEELGVSTNQGGQDSQDSTSVTNDQPEDENTVPEPAQENDATDKKRSTMSRYQLVFLDEDKHDDLGKMRKKEACDKALACNTQGKKVELYRIDKNENRKKVDFLNKKKTSPGSQVGESGQKKKTHCRLRWFKFSYVDGAGDDVQTEKKKMHSAEMRSCFSELVQKQKDVMAIYVDKNQNEYKLLKPLENLSEKELIKKVKKKNKIVQLNKSSGPSNSVSATGVLKKCVIVYKEDDTIIRRYVDKISKSAACMMAKSKMAGSTENVGLYHLCSNQTINKIDIETGKVEEVDVIIPGITYQKGRGYSRFLLSYDVGWEKNIKIFIGKMTKSQAVEIAMEKSKTIRKDVQLILLTKGNKEEKFGRIEYKVGSSDLGFLSTDEKSTKSSLIKKDDIDPAQVNEGGNNQKEEDGKAQEPGHQESSADKRQAPENDLTAETLKELRSGKQVKLDLVIGGIFSLTGTLTFLDN